METDRIYESPVIEIIEVEVEKGFAISNIGGENGGWESQSSCYSEFEDQY